tara:strand:+ start:228 stop:719 length:492 start_codon:yes stop_codon:yes gene_type:complete
VEATVRSIHTERCSGCKPALCFRGKEYALGIINSEEGIISVRLDLRDHDRSAILNLGEEEYPVYKFISHIERIMQRKPISEECLTLIRQWPNTPEDFGIPVIEDEPTDKPIIKRKSPGKNCIATIAEEMGLATTKIRKYLRGQGMKAPYEDETKIRTVLKDYK